MENFDQLRVYDQSTSTLEMDDLSTRRKPNVSLRRRSRHWKNSRASAVKMVIGKRCLIPSLCASMTTTLAKKSRHVCLTLTVYQLKKWELTRDKNYGMAYVKHSCERAKIRERFAAEQALVLRKTQEATPSTNKPRRKKK